jgi:hypothetical protein
MVGRVRLIAASFAWPFAGRWRSRFAIGVLAVLLLPVAFVPLLGYAIAATRAAALEPEGPPPPWHWSSRLLIDGLWTVIAIALITAPFSLLVSPLASALDSAHLWNVSDRALSSVYAHVVAGFVLALPWGLVLLLHMPHASVRYALGSRPLDLFDLPASWRSVRREFPTWNLVAAAIVTAWVLGAACVGLLCAGILPGLFYAILVSAHASAALVATTGSPAVGAREDPPAR